MKRTARLVLVAAAALSLVALTVAPAQAGGRALIQGSGSSWSSNAVNQWIADVQTKGLQVVYTASGSAQGRKDFGYKTADFAVSDIGYQGVDKVTGDTDTSQGRAFAYLPIVAGGTSFPYQIRVSGKLVRDLRLSGDTLAKIFTNRITNWNDPAITRDNNGRKLPSLQIRPVVHSEGSGSSAQLTRYLDTVHPSLWRSFLGTSGFTEYFPRKGKAIAQNGSDGVMNYIASSAANGAIGYDEYSYALAKNYPVAKVLNKAGYYTLPTQYNVAVALTQAVINQDKTSKDYLLQNLDRVYVYGDKRTYPLSSYSYAIIPTASNDATMTTAKRQTLADYLYYSICQGQREVGPIGFSPLPINLVQASFAQTAKLKAADPAVDIAKRDVTTCKNPTFIAGQPKRNYLAQIAPVPPPCDKDGQGPCGTSTGSGSSGNGSSGAGSSGSGGSQGGTSPTGGQSGASGAPATGSTGQTDSGATTVDPETGAVSGSASGATVADAVAVPVELNAYEQPQMARTLGILAAGLLGLVLVVPPLLARRLSRRGTGDPS